MAQKGYYEPYRIDGFDQMEQGYVLSQFVTWPCCLPADDPKHEGHRWVYTAISLKDEHQIREHGAVADWSPVLRVNGEDARFCLRCGANAAEAKR